MSDRSATTNTDFCLLKSQIILILTETEEITQQVAKYSVMLLVLLSLLISLLQFIWKLFQSKQFSVNYFDILLLFYVLSIGHFIFDNNISYDQLCKTNSSLKSTSTSATTKPLIISSDIDIYYLIAVISIIISLISSKAWNKTTNNVSIETSNSNIKSKILGISLLILFISIIFMLFDIYFVAFINSK